MSALDRFALVAAAAGDAARTSPRQARWRRYRDPLTGLSFEAPFAMEPEAGDLFETLVGGRMTLPYVFDVTYLASSGPLEAEPEAMARGMATQWMVDHDLAVGPAVRRLDRPGIDEAWSVYAEIEEVAGSLGYAWLTLRKGDRVGCVGVSCWTVERQGRAALHRTLSSISGV